MVFSLFLVMLLYSYFMMEQNQTLLYLFLIIFLGYSFISLSVSRKYGAVIMGWPSVIRNKDYTSFLIAIPETGLIFSVLISLYNEIFGFYEILTVALGFILMFVGMGFNLMVRRELGKNWVPLAKTTDNQELITSGIYSRVRHPFYTSILILFLGVAIIAWNWYGLFFFIFFIVGLLIRIKKEESELILKFGEKYENYMEKTPKLIPRL